MINPNDNTNEKIEKLTEYLIEINKQLNNFNREKSKEIILKVKELIPKESITAEIITTTATKCEWVPIDNFSNEELYNKLYLYKKLCECEIAKFTGNQLIKN